MSSPPARVASEALGSPPAAQGCLSEGAHNWQVGDKVRLHTSPAIIVFLYKDFCRLCIRGTGREVLYIDAWVSEISHR